jgi:hypothetical protein
MYQDNIPKNMVETLKNYKSKLPELSVFERHDLSPLTYQPIEMLEGVYHIARDILIKRTADEIITISKAIKNMLSHGDSLLLALLVNDDKQESIYSSEGRSLYFLHHYFDLSTLNIEQLSWSDVFAVLALMQCAEVTVSTDKKFDDGALSLALKQSNDLFVLHQQSEIADTIARAEVLADININHKKSGSTGGKTKAEKILALKVIVIKLYLDKYSLQDNKRAGAIIEAELSQENSSLLLLSNAQDKAVQFATWISQFRNKKFKLPI